MDTNVLNQETVTMDEMVISPITVENLDHNLALKHYSEDKREMIINFSNKIDFLKKEQLMSYGSTPLKESMSKSQEFLKVEKNGAADQQVIADAVQISRDVKASYEEFKLMIEKSGGIPGELSKFKSFFRRIFKLEDMDDPELFIVKAKNCYDLVVKFCGKCEEGLIIMDKNNADTTQAIKNVRNTINSLEEYITAANIALERGNIECEQLKEEYEQSGHLQILEEQYQNKKRGYEILAIMVNNLEQSRASLKLGCAQLCIISETNENIRISLKTKSVNTLEALTRELMIAVMDKKNQAVLKGQRDLMKFVDELQKKTSENVIMTAKQAQVLIEAGVFTFEGLAGSVRTIVNGINELEKSRDNLLNVVVENTKQVRAITEELDSVSNRMRNLLPTEVVKNVEGYSSSSTSASESTGGLVL